MMFDLDLKEKMITNYKYGYVNCNPMGQRVRKVLEISTRGDLTSRDELESILDKVGDEIEVCVCDYVCIDVRIKTPSFSMDYEVGYPYFHDIVKNEICDGCFSKKKGVSR